MKEGILAELRCALLAAALMGCVTSGSAQSVSPTPAEMDDLLVKYKEFELPLAPKKAELVRVSLRGNEHFVGFRLKKQRGWKPAEFLIGTVRCREYLGPIEAQSPTQLKTDGFRATSGLNDLDEAFEINIGLATALQCHARGYTELAQQLWMASVVKGVGFNMPSAFTHPSGLPAQTSLAYLAWTHSANELVQPRSDRKLVLQRMKALLKADWQLDTVYRRQLVKDLEAALAPRAARAGSIEARINELVDLSYHFPPSRYDMSFMEAPPESYFALAPFGFEAVPALVSHLEDQRLTRSKQYGKDNFPSYVRHLNDIVSDILQDLAGQNLASGWRTRWNSAISPDNVTGWFEAAKREGEENYLASHALTDARYDNGHNRYMLRVLAHKYPCRLVGMYRKVLSDEPETDSDLLAEAVSLSQLPSKEKVDVLWEGSTNAVFWHRLRALSHMKKVDERRFKQILMKQLREIPAAPATHSVLGGNIAYAVITVGDPRLWKALTAAAHRADSEFKADAMWAMCNSRPQEIQPSERAQFLESFLDDRTAANPKRFGTNLFSQAEIRNLAAEHLGHRVGIYRSKDPNWTAEQWKEFREQVRKELKRRLRESHR